jgi:hypothetical protein
MVRRTSSILNIQGTIFPGSDFHSSSKSLSVGLALSHDSSSISSSQNPFCMYVV